MNMEANFLNNPNEEKDLSEIEKKRKKVEDLKYSDNPYEDSIKDVAESEGKFREELTEVGITDKKVIDKLANSFSDEVVSKKEVGKEVWEDKMTGLRNKNAYNEELPQLIELSKRNEQESSFLMIDFDHFKRVNDVYGHSAGDIVLQKIAGVISDSVRSSDIVYRYGGEEFIAYLPDTTSAEASILAERIRSEVEAANIEIMDNDGNDVVLKKTVSIGCVGTDAIDDWQQVDDKKLLEKISQYADSALYKSKENGRNQVTIFSEKMEG